MSLNAEDLIPKVAKLVSLARAKAEVDALVLADVSNQLNAVADAGATDNMQVIVDSVAKEIEAEVTRINSGK